jgi:hypothetical protein
MISAITRMMISSGIPMFHMTTELLTSAGAPFLDVSAWASPTGKFLASTSLDYRNPVWTGSR